MENISDLQGVVDYVSANSELTQAESAAALGGIFGMFAGIATMLAVIGLVIYILLVIAQWRIFNKAGEKGWKSIIPVYNAYIYCKIIGVSFWKWLGALVLAGLFVSIGDSSKIQWLASLAGVVQGGLTLAFFIILARNAGRAFGKGTGFKIGLFFLPTIFKLILGLGASEYKGVPEE